MIDAIMGIAFVAIGVAWLLLVVAVNFASGRSGRRRSQ